MATTFAELEAQANRPAQQTIGDVRGVICRLAALADDERIDASIVRELTESCALSLKDVLRLRKRVKHRHDADKLLNVALGLRAERAAAEAEKLRLETAPIGDQHVDQRRYELERLQKRCADLSGEIATMEGQVLDVLKSTAASTGNHRDWRNFSLEFPKPSKALEGLPVM